ncbi:MAG: SEL1-like repeat protein [Geobacteraceae bacterium]
MYRLGVMYANGYGVEKDKKEAIKWYKKAAFKGFVPAKDALKRLEKSSK